MSGDVKAAALCSALAAVFALLTCFQPDWPNDCAGRCKAEYNSCACNCEAHGGGDGCYQTCSDAFDACTTACGGG